MRRTLLLLTGAALAVAAMRPFRVEVAGASMEPTLKPGDWLLATRAGRRRRGALVVVPDPRSGLPLVKRIVEVRGTEVEVRGDNPDASTDSRTFGAIPMTAIEGVVRLRYHPRPALMR